MKLIPYNVMNKPFPFMEEPGAGGGGNPTPPEPEPTPTPEPEPKPQTFDDILQNKEFQAEFDRRMQKGIKTALENERTRLEGIYNKKLTEQEKLAKMNEDEKKVYEQQKRDKELAEREANITKRELTAEAKNTLADKNLPAELVDLINYESADTVKASIETIEKAFTKAVQAAVDERLKGPKPPKDSHTEGDPTDDDPFDAVIKKYRKDK